LYWIEKNGQRCYFIEGTEEQLREILGSKESGMLKYQRKHAKDQPRCMSPSMHYGTTFY